MLTQVAPSQRSAEPKRLRLVKALQSPSDGAGSNRRGDPAVMTHAPPSPRHAESRQLRQQGTAETRLRRRIQGSPGRVPSVLTQAAFCQNCIAEITVGRRV